MEDHVAELITRNEVARRLGCSIASVRRMEGTDLHPLIGADGVRHFDQGEVAAVAARRGEPRVAAPPRNDERTAFAVGEPIPGLAPPLRPAPPHRQKTFLERAAEAAARQSAWDALMDRSDAETEAREALEEKRQARRDREEARLRGRLATFWSPPAPPTLTTPPPAPAAALVDHETSAIVRDLQDLLGIGDDE